MNIRINNLKEATNINNEDSMILEQIGGTKKVSILSLKTFIKGVVKTIKSEMINIESIQLTPLDKEPSPIIGMIYFDNTIKNFKICENGKDWRVL